MRMITAAVGLALIVSGCDPQKPAVTTEQPKALENCAPGTTRIPFGTGSTCVGQDFANMRVCLETSMDSSVVKTGSDEVLTSVGVTVSSSNSMTIGAENAVKLTNGIIAKAKPDPNGCNQIKACMSTQKLTTENITCDAAK